MRKVTKQIAEALKGGVSKTVSNTSTFEGNVYLHGNRIAQMHKDGTVYMSLAGWNTPTTRERLNGIAKVLGIKARFSQKNFDPYFNDKPIGKNQWIQIN
tara:strand:- start:707 stop:1003 length:297 start_codon:yes stop_codon:yes gene_type:complete